MHLRDVLDTAKRLAREMESEENRELVMERAVPTL